MLAYLVSVLSLAYLLAPTSASWSAGPYNPDWEMRAALLPPPSSPT